MSPPVAPRPRHRLGASRNGTSLVRILLITPRITVVEMLQIFLPFTPVVDSAKA